MKKGKAMGHIDGLRNYLKTAYNISVFDQALETKELWTMHLHGLRVVQARVVENKQYELVIDIAGQDPEEIHKLQVKCLYPAEHTDAFAKMLKIDKKIQALGLEPIYAPAERYNIKNKTLFPLMQERQVVFCTLMEGELIRGIVGEFSRYDLTIHAKGGLPVTLLRHGIYDMRNKQGRCMLKSFQQQHRDWEKSAFFVTP
jgi:hypothetical protein